MKFNLGGQTQSTQGASAQLGVGIHDVKFVSLTPEIIEKKDGSATFDVVKIRFEDAAGKDYTHTVFEPRPGDDIRKDNSFGYKNPSMLEEMQFLFGHLIAAVAPETAKQMEAKGNIELDSWDKVKAFLVKVTAKSGGTQTQIKLVPNKEGRGVFPSFVLGVSKKDEVYPRTNFIGKGLTYTANELKAIDTKANARPSAMPDLNRSINSAATSDDDLDLDLDLV
jgi:hypothetical protein